MVNRDFTFGCITVTLGNCATWCGTMVQPESIAGVQLLAVTFSAPITGWWSEKNPLPRTDNVNGSVSGQVPVGAWLQSLDSLVVFATQSTNGPYYSNNTDAIAIVVVPYALNPADESNRVRPTAVGSPSNPTIAAHRSTPLWMSATVPSVINTDTVDAIVDFGNTAVVYPNQRPTIAYSSQFYAGFCGELWTGWGVASQVPQLQYLGYGRETSARLSDTMLMALSQDGTASERREIARRIAQVGVDLFGAFVSGRDDKADGGHYQGRKAAVVWAGHFLNQSWVNINALVGNKFHEDEQYYTGSPAWAWGWPYGYLGSSDYPTDLVSPVANWGSNFRTMFYLTGYFQHCLGSNIGQALAMQIIGRTAEMGVAHRGMVAQWMQGPGPANLAAIDAIFVDCIDTRDWVRNISFINTTTNTITCSAIHGWSSTPDRQKVRMFSTGTLPTVTGTTLTSNTVLYVNYTNGGADLRLSLSESGGSDLDFIDSGTGALTLHSVFMQHPRDIDWSGGYSYGVDGFSRWTEGSWIAYNTYSPGPGGTPASATSDTLTLSVTQNSPSVVIRANTTSSTINLTLEAPSTTKVYQGPGTNDYRSTRYTASVAGKVAYVYGFARTTEPPADIWTQGQLVEMSFVKYESEVETTVAISRIAGPVTSAVVYPKNVATQIIVGGILILGVPRDTYLQVAINNDQANLLHVFSRLPKREIGTVTNWIDIPSITVSSINLPTNTITCAVAHGWSTGQRLLLATTGSLPTVSGDALSVNEAVFISFASGSDLRLSRTSGGSDIDFTSSGAGILTLKRGNANIDEAIYFGPGVHRIGRLFDLANNVRIYVDADSLLIGSFDLRGCDGVIIEGFGVLAGLFAESEYVQSLTDFYNEKVLYSMFLGYDNSKWFFDNEVEGITITRCPYYMEFVAINRWVNAQIINPWSFECNGLQVIAKSPSEPVALVDNCFGLSCDDNLTLGEQVSGITLTVRKSIIMSVVNSNIHLSYWPTPIIPNRPLLIEDCHASHLGVADSGTTNIYPRFATRTVFKSLTDGSIGQENYGRANVTIRNLKVWRPIRGRLTVLGNVAYPFGTTADQTGQVYNFTLENIDTEFAPEQISYIVGKDNVNTPHDITINNMRLGGNLVTTSNFDDYFYMNTYPRNIIVDGQDIRLFADATTQSISLVAPVATASIPESTTSSSLALSLAINPATSVIAASTISATQTIVLTINQAMASVFTAPILGVQSMNFSQLTATSRVSVITNIGSISISLNAPDQPQDIPAYASSQSMGLAILSVSVRTGSSTTVALQTMNMSAPAQPQPTIATATLQILNLSSNQAVGVGTVLAPVTSINMAMLPIDAYAINPSTVISSTIALSLLIWTQQVRVAASITSGTISVALSYNDAAATTGSSTTVARQLMYFTQQESESTSASSTTNIPQILSTSTFDPSVRLGTKADAGTLLLLLNTVDAQIGNEALARHDPIYSYLMQVTPRVDVVGTADSDLLGLSLSAVDVLLDTSVIAEATPIFLGIEAQYVEGVGYIAIPTQPTIPTGETRDLLSSEIQYNPDLKEEWRIVQS